MSRPKEVVDASQGSVGAKADAQEHEVTARRSGSRTPSANWRGSSPYGIGGRAVGSIGLADERQADLTLKLRALGRVSVMSYDKSRRVFWKSDPGEGGPRVTS